MKKVIIATTFLAQLVLLVYILERVITTKDLFILVVCYAACELIFEMCGEISLTKGVLKTFVKDNKNE